MEYVAKYGDDDVQARTDQVREFFSRPGSRPKVLDEFEAVGITQKSDIRDKFVPNFFFGCEADDPLTAWAFREDVNPLGAKLQPLFGSDISHWDVPDMTEPVEEAYELVEHGLLDDGPVPRVHVPQRGQAARRDEPVVLRRHRRRATGGAGADRDRAGDGRMTARPGQAYRAVVRSREVKRKRPAAAGVIIT